MLPFCGRCSSEQDEFFQLSKFSSEEASMVEPRISVDTSDNRFRWSLDIQGVCGISAIDRKTVSSRFISLWHLYGSALSPPCRAILFRCSYLSDVDFNYVYFTPDKMQNDKTHIQSQDITCSWCRELDLTLPSSSNDDFSNDSLWSSSVRPFSARPAATSLGALIFFVVVSQGSEMFLNLTVMLVTRGWLFSSWSLLITDLEWPSLLETSRWVSGWLELNSTLFASCEANLKLLACAFSCLVKRMFFSGCTKIM